MTLMRHIKTTPVVFRLFFLAMGGVLAITSFSNQTCAQGAGSACDPEFMDAIESRAWLEVQREISQNKNIISKPDSVLEYTCFIEHLDVLADKASTPMFSDLHESVNHVGQMETSLRQLVLASVNSYLGANYNHDYIDGRGGGLSPDPIAQDGSYTCAEMAKVWSASQCLDFQNEAEDGFYTLDWYVGNDPRSRADPACTPAGGTSAYLSSAYNGNSAAYAVNNGAPDDGTTYPKDAVQSFVSFIEPGSCSEPIPTGLIVHRENYTYERYCDHVCSNPGCYYQPDSGLPGTTTGGPPCSAGGAGGGPPGTRGSCVGP